MRIAKDKVSFATPIALAALIESVAASPNVPPAAVSASTPVAIGGVGINLAIQGAVATASRRTVGSTGLFTAN